LTLRKRGRAGLKSPAASWVTAALKALVVRVDARRVIGELSGCWDRRETGVDSARAVSRPLAVAAWGRLAVSGPSGWCACLAGCARLGRDRGLALWRATKPVGAWGKSRRARLSLLRAMQRDVDLIAYGQFSLQPAARRYATFWQPLFW